MLPRGKFDTLVSFQRAQIVKSPLGVEKSTVWAPIEDALANVRYGSSQERRNGVSEGATQTATFRVLGTMALRDVTETDRIVMKQGGAAWNVIGGVPVGSGELEFTATLAKG